MNVRKSVPADVDAGWVVVAQRKAAGLDRPAIYAALRASGLRISARDMVRMAGYGKRSSYTVNKSQGVQAALATIEEQRETLQRSPGLTIGDSVHFLKDVRDNKNVNDDTRIRADERIAKLLGYDAAPKPDQTAGAQIMGAIAMLAQIAQAAAQGRLSAITDAVNVTDATIIEDDAT